MGVVDDFAFKSDSSVEQAAWSFSVYDMIAEWFPACVNTGLGVDHKGEATPPRTEVFDFCPPVIERDEIRDLIEVKFKDRRDTGLEAITMRFFKEGLVNRNHSEMILAQKSEKSKLNVLQLLDTKMKRVYNEGI